MPAIADYGDLSPGLYQIQNCEILARKPGEEHFVQFAECNTARINITGTSIKRKAKNKRTRYVVVEHNIDTEATLDLEAMTFTRIVNELRLQGDGEDLVQAAGAWTFNIKHAQIGGIYNVGKHNIAAIVTGTENVYDENTDTYTPGAALAGLQYKVVDEADGNVQLLGGFANGDCIQIAGNATEITAAEALLGVDFGSNLNQELELRVRGLSEIGTPFVFYDLFWKGKPNGMDLIGGDDYSAQNFTGTLTGRNGRIGRWQQLSV
ncbi:hypothetical protein [Devosia faecipullorum]|uniref:hypothetical protein n=1 Tax=Devosia faecipullorum TaxID=2755039 RepID=UPI00187B993A|nr:hypothetical protein [Devosia faecipullorum]MBE7732175.1 hypothetical protein [Devosia faecipullorum]